MAFPGSEELVAAAEARLGRRLPEAHRQRLLRDNGGEIRADRQTWTLYPVWDASTRKTIGRTANHIIRENEAHRRDWPDIFPPDHFAIADNGGGDVLLLGPEGDEVLFWDHETGEMTRVNVKPLVHSSHRGANPYCPNHSTGVRLLEDFVVTPLQYVE